MKKLLLSCFIAVVFLAGIFCFLSLPLSADTRLADFAVNQGDGISLIASRLESNHLIRNRFVFILSARVLNLHRRLQAGTFRLSPSFSTGEIIQRLSQGGRSDYWLKVIDGTRLEEITPSFPKNKEGYLFPDSYLIPADYSLDDILEVIAKNFDSKFSQAKLSSTSQLSDRQSVILASLLEREGRTLETKQKIAGVLLNRLNINMALQVDATVQYARDTLRHPKDYWQSLAKTDLKISSPYNTYLHPGLPPGPICNPGYDSLYAAFHPIASDYLFYITDSQGRLHLASTLADHNANIARYLK